MLQFKSIDNTKIHMIKELNELFTNNPSLILIILAIVVVILWLIVKHYSIAYSDELGKIDGRLENLTKVVDIEKAIAEALSKVDMKFWREKQVEDLKREKLELLMMELDADMTLANKSYNTNNYLGQKNTVAALINLYFHNLQDIKDKYLKQRRIVKENVFHTATLIEDRIKISVDIMEKFMGDYSKLQYVYEELVDRIVDEAKKLNFNSLLDSK